MIYPVIGISMLVHIGIVAFKKTGEFLIKLRSKTLKMNVIKKAVLSLAIAVIIEAILILVATSSFFILSNGLESEKSNANILKAFLMR